MKIIKCAYSKTFPISQFFEKIYLEAELNEGDDTRKVLYDLKKQVSDFFYESNKADEKKAEKIIEQKITDDWASATPNEKIIAQINSFKEISGPNGLESFRLIVKGKKDLETAYNNRLKELT